MAVSPDVPTIGRQAAGLAEEIFTGATPAEAFQSPAGSEITVNLTAARRYELELNEDALASVNRIIE